MLKVLKDHYYGKLGFQLLHIVGELIEGLTDKIETNLKTIFLLYFNE